MSYIRTSSNKIFNYLDLENSQIDIDDIATALSFIPRWLGHTNKFYSVAQHCCWCADHTEGNRLEALMHDATEAYLSDLPSPLKALLPDYQNMEKNVSIVLAIKFGFDYPYSIETHEVDKKALQIERIFIKGLDKNYEPLENKVNINAFEYWSSEKAKEEFLKRFKNLKIQNNE